MNIGDDRLRRLTQRYQNRERDEAQRQLEIARVQAELHRTRARQHEAERELLALESEDLADELEAAASVQQQPPPQPPVGQEPAAPQAGSEFAEAAQHGPGSAQFREFIKKQTREARSGSKELL
mgnify:CR=1 FL=1